MTLLLGEFGVRHDQAVFAPSGLVWWHSYSPSPPLDLS
jgi:hypothetical protein